MSSLMGQWDLAFKIRVHMREEADSIAKGQVGVPRLIVNNQVVRRVSREVDGQIGRQVFWEVKGR